MNRPAASTGTALALAMTLALLVVGSAAAQTVVSLVPPSGNFQCHETWTIDVNVDADATDLRGCSLVIEFHDDVIRPISVTAGALVAGAACPNFTYWFGPAAADSVAVDVAALGCSVSGPGAIARITFEGYAGGTSPITLRRGDLRNGLNESIPFTAIGAQVHYDCAVETRSWNWGSVKAVYR
jgi:hypothetical protein